MNAIDNLLEGLFDYAGLYPPANLDVPSAVANYQRYRESADAPALGRLVADLARVEAIEKAAGDGFRSTKLTVVGAANSDWGNLARLIAHGACIEAVEVRAATPAEVGCLVRGIPQQLHAYFEVPVDRASAPMFDAICAAGAKVKLRMGGVVADAFPSAEDVASTLQAIADRHLGFKATAGLHHPLRSCHPFEDAPGGASGMMHGFMNLFCAAALVHFGGAVEDATRILDETNAEAWSVRKGAIAWRGFRWSQEQIREVRQEFFDSIGSCSFTEPMADLEALGWR
jgi:hypothetical protein